MSMVNVLPTILVSKLRVIAVCCLLGAFSFSCRSNPSEGAPPPARTINEIPPITKETYELTRRLYSYVWSREKFTNPENKAEISHLLRTLSSDFHPQSFPGNELEPGYRIILRVSQNMLKDAKERFDQGMTDYSLWRLRGLVANCIACHSRYQANTDFIGDVPRGLGMSYESRMARNDFLFASRQFNKAATELISTARSYSGNASMVFQALKQWLVIEVRVKEEFTKAAGILEALLPDLELPWEYADTVAQWIDELRMLGNETQPTRKYEAAERLLAPVATSESIVEDERHLVTTLRATALLHYYLEGKRQPDERRRALYLLGLAYSHIPIERLSIFREMYLEQCIREFPMTKEAKQAFELYKRNIELLNTGSRGLQLGQREEQHLRELNLLAYGSKGARISEKRRKASPLEIPRQGTRT